MEDFSWMCMPNSGKSYTLSRIRTNYHKMSQKYGYMMAYQGPCECPNCGQKVRAGRVHVVLEAVESVQNRCLDASLKEMRQALDEKILVDARKALFSAED